MGEALTMIKAISKKKEDIIKARREAFIRGALERGLDEQSAQQIFELIEYFAGYGFNKAHSTAYAYLAYKMAYLRAHYPVQFFAASMTCERSNRDQVIAFVKDASAHGIEILPPSINKSTNEFRTEGRAIRYGLGAIKNVGEKAVEAIVAERQANGPFASLYDLCERVDHRAVNRATLEALIRSGACDEFSTNRAALLAALDDALQAGAAAQQDRARGQVGLFDALDIPHHKPEEKLPEVEDAPQAERLAWENDLLGFYVSGHPLAPYKDILETYATATTAQLPALEDGTEVVVGGVIEAVRRSLTRKGRFQGQRWARFELSDLEGRANGVCFAQEYASYGRFLTKGTVVLIRARVDYQGEEPTLRAQEIVPIERAHNALAAAMVVDLDSEAADAATLTSLRDLCASHHGPLPVYVRIHTPTDGTYVVRVGRAMFVEASQELYREAESLVGRDRVRFVARPLNGNGQNGNRGRESFSRRR